MSHYTDSPDFIRYPWQLLYYLTLRPFTLARYIQSIDNRLDNRLMLWEVRGSATKNDPRFRALSRAKTWLLILMSWLCSLVLAIFYWFFDTSYNIEILLFNIGYLLILLIGDKIYWGFPKARFRVALGFIGFGVLIGSCVFPLLVFAKPYFLAISNFFTYSFIVLGVGTGIGIGLDFKAILSAVIGFLCSAITIGFLLTVMSFKGNSGDFLLFFFVMPFWGLLLALLVRTSYFIYRFVLYLPLYLLWDVPRSYWLGLQAKREPSQALTLWSKHPIHNNESLLLPLPYLREHLSLLAHVSPETCIKALEAVNVSMQKGIVNPTITLIIEQAILRANTPPLIARFAEGMEWLPIRTLSPYLQELFKDLITISRDVNGALTSFTGNARETLLREVTFRLNKLHTTLNDRDTDLSSFVYPLSVWERVLIEKASQVQLERQMMGELPLLYQAGSVLEKGATTFKGRTDLFRALEELLVNPRQKSSPLLLGQPRTGKSSALRQLPLRLGAQVLPVYLNMEQYATTNSAVSLLSDIADAICMEARNHPLPLVLDIPDATLIQDDPYRAFKIWLTGVERKLGNQRWLFLVLDEFNRLDVAIGRGRLDERIFWLFRDLIQYHPNIVLGLCGTFSLSECDPRWYDSLKSVHEIVVSYLPPKDARAVLSEPSSDFPSNVYTEEALNRAIYETGGQPYLLQILGQRVISTYNREREQLPPSTPAGYPLPESVIEVALPDVLSSANPFFNSLWGWILRIGGNPNLTASLLRALSNGEAITNIGDSYQRAEMLEIYRERELLELSPTDGYRFRVPLVARWISTQSRLTTKFAED